jgi:hypothetical protein
VSGCKDFTRPVALSVMYILNHPETLHSKLIRVILKFEDSFLAFLDSHVQLVDFHLRRMRGTSGTSGSHYLKFSRNAQVIWRDLYYLEKHAKSFIDWDHANAEIRVVTEAVDPHIEIMKEL